MLEIQQRKGHSEHAVYRYEDVSSHGSQTCYVIENKAPNGMIARFKGGAEMDYLVQAMDDVDVMAEAMKRIRSIRGVNYILQLDPLESGAIEHLALMDLTSEMED